MDKEIKKRLSRNWFKLLQDVICFEIESLEKKNKKFVKKICLIEPDRNLHQLLKKKFKNKKIEEIKTESDVPITEAFELYLRNYFFDLKETAVKNKVLSSFLQIFSIPHYTKYCWNST